MSVADDGRSLYKLRSMRVGAEFGPDITVARDPRVTRVGVFLRRTRIDELPQLWNVVRGDMSLVGPRPEVPGIVKHYDASWEPLLQVRPGMTDEATLAFRDEGTLLGPGGHSYEEDILPAKARLALKGVRSRSFTYDLSILLRTIGAVTGIASARDHPAVAELRMRAPRTKIREVA